MKKKIAFLTALGTLGAVLLTGCGSPAGASQATSMSQAPVIFNPASYDTKNTVTVQSSEKVTVTPDIAQIVYAVRSESSSAADCQQKNTEDVNKVIELLKSLGIAENSIQTSDYRMSPLYSYTNNIQKVTGYEAVTALTVTDVPISILGDVLSQSVTAGINDINSITYQSGSYDESYQEALALAMDSAKVKAQALADAGGCSLGGVAGITENSGYTEARYQDNALAFKMLDVRTEELSAGTTNIMPGQIEVEVNLTVEYLLSNPAD